MAVAEIGGALSGTVTEDATLVVEGLALISGQGDTVGVFDSGSFAGIYGSLTLINSGAWAYTLDNSLNTVQALTSNTVAHEYFGVSWGYGLAQSLIDIVVTGANDPASIGGDLTETLQARSSSSVSGQVEIYDVDVGEKAIVSATLTGKFGSLTIGRNGEWQYALLPGQQTAIQDESKNGVDSFVISSVDGTLATLTVFVAGGAAPITGSDGNDTITGGPGNDTIDGGAGIDTAVFSGKSTEYLVTYDSIASAYSVKDTVSSRDGTDKLASVELLQFSDGVKQLATSDALSVQRVHQALFGKAPSSATFNQSLATIGPSGSAFDWAKVEASSLSALSDSAFSTLVLNNMSINNTSLTATATFGTSQQTYDSLQQALADYLGAAGSANRGIVVTQFAQILAGYEGETVFGVYGAAATAFNRQVASDLAHSINTQNTTEVVVVPVFATGTSSAVGSDFDYMLAMGSYAYQISGFGSGDKIVSPAGVSGTLVNGSATDGIASIQYVSGSQTVSITLTGLTTAQDSALHGTTDLNTVFGLGAFI